MGLKTWLSNTYDDLFGSEEYKLPQYVRNIYVNNKGHLTPYADGIDDKDRNIYHKYLPNSGGKYITGRDRSMIDKIVNEETRYMNLENKENMIRHTGIPLTREELIDLKILKPIHDQRKKEAKQAEYMLYDKWRDDAVAQHNAAKMNVKLSESMTGGAGEPRQPHSMMTIIAVIVVALLVLFILYNCMHLSPLLTQFLMVSIVGLTSLYLVEMLTR